MKVYRFNGTNEEFECEEEAIDYLMRMIGFNFDDTVDSEQIERQAEMRSVLMETYFCEKYKEEAEESAYDYFFDKGFHEDVLVKREV